MDLKIKPLSPKIGNEIPYPYYATPGAAAMDLCACLDAPVEIAPRALVTIPTGIAIALPSAEFVALVFARSGLGIKHGISLSNGVGVIDSDYRGEIRVGLANLSDTPYIIQPGDRIAQLAVMPVARPALQFTDELDETSRGAGGLGSTGK
ncbi:Deoxyuridine 5'-triphosphate nucleotidohydrolase [uncultured Eubacteriales bacterium]|uniref:Deoxyuridine 5'-triphosphate nucleotidohydrolase n=1 Tax=uncultured Eubacteriales bacterium TaxID=172733 RepID=A0A212KHL7_9FIRM|nr:Deoxyuridine 5'-triphosphate nucleotidohydrolase [uncultured Eubacteriales bacterium]